jgi:outer membrane protein OmpA-like peptidoglycan-associated protein
MRWTLLLCASCFLFPQSLLAEQTPTQPLGAAEIIEQLAPPQPASSPVRTRGFRIAPRQIDFQIQFDFNSDRIRPDATAQLREIARAMTAPQLASLQFRIEGHTDAAGSATYNADLSERRARRIVHFLVDQGIASERLHAEGKGMSELLTPEEPLAAANRRVRIVTLN